MSESGPPSRLENAGMSAPELGISGLLDGVQIRNHGGSMFAFVTDATDGLIEFLAIFTVTRLCMTNCTIAPENSLPVALSNGEVMRATNSRHGDNHSRKNCDFDCKCFQTPIGTDHDCLEQNATFTRNIYRYADLAADTGRNQPRQGRQLCRCATARRVDVQDGHVVR